MKKEPNAFYIPLEKAVEEILQYMVFEGLLKQEQCLFGFPHPSGANGHRKKVFLENKIDMQKTIDFYLSSMFDRK